MTFRSWLRKKVNREDQVGPVRLGLLRVIDPIEWYMAKSDEDRRRRLHHRGTGAAGWVTYAPFEPERSVRGDEVRTIDPPKPPDDSDERLDEYLGRREVLLERELPYLEQKATDLLEGRDALIRTNRGAVRARLVRFRNGAVFEYWHASDRSSGHGMSRIDRSHLVDPVGQLVGCLADATLNMD